MRWRMVPLCQPPSLGSKSVSRVPSGSITSGSDSGAYWLTMSRLAGMVWKYSRWASLSLAKANWMASSIILTS